MTGEELNVFGIAVAVAAACLEDEKPDAADMTNEDACEYVGHILSLALANTGIGSRVRPLAYPACSKMPLIISLTGLGERLIWFYPDSDPALLASDLNGALCDLIQCASGVPA